MTLIPKICPNCGTLPATSYTESQKDGLGSYMYIGCGECGRHTRLVHIGDPYKGDYYQKVISLYPVAVALWNRLRRS